MIGKQFPRYLAAACAAVLLAAGAASGITAGSVFSFKPALPSVHSRMIADGAYFYLSSDGGVAGLSRTRHDDVAGAMTTWRNNGQAFVYSFARHPATGKVYAWGPYGVIALPERSTVVPAAALADLRDDWGYGVHGGSRLAVDHSGRLWFAVQKTGNDGLPRDAHHGVYLWDGSALSRLVEAPAYAVYVDANGDVYASSEQGVHRWASGGGAPALVWDAYMEGRWPGGYARFGGTLYVAMRDYANRQADLWNTGTFLYRWDGGTGSFAAVADLCTGSVSDFEPVPGPGALYLRAHGSHLLYTYDGSTLTDVTAAEPFGGFSYVSAMAFSGGRLYLSGQNGPENHPIAVYESGVLTKHTEAEFRDPAVPTFVGTRHVAPGGLWQSFIPGSAPQDLWDKALLFGPGGGASLKTLPAARTIVSVGAWQGSDFLLLSMGEICRHDDGAIAADGAFGASVGRGWVDPSKGVIWAAKNYAATLGGKPWVRSALALYDIGGKKVAYGMRNPATGAVVFPTAESEWTYDEVYGSGMKHGVRAVTPIPGEDAVMIAAVDLQTSGGASADLVMRKYSYGGNAFTPSALPRAVSDASGALTVLSAAGSEALYLLARKSDGSHFLFVYRGGAWSEGPDLSAILAAGERAFGLAVIPVPAADRLVLRTVNGDSTAYAVYVLNTATGTAARLADGDTPLDGESLIGVQNHAPGRARVWFGKNFGVKYCDLEFETEAAR